MARLIVGLLIALLIPWNIVQAQETPADRAPSARTKKNKKVNPSSPLVRKIVVKGMRKIEEDAVRSRLTSRVGEPFDIENIRQDVRDLFKTGYFYDVTVDRDDKSSGVELTYLLVEKPSIVSIDYRGNTELDDSELR